MMISTTLFATRGGRMIGPILCIVGAAVALIAGGAANLILAAAFLLATVLFKVAAELSGRQARLESRIRSMRRNLEGITGTMQPLDARVAEAEAAIGAASARLDSTMPALAELEERHSKLDRQLALVIESLEPIRRHRVEANEGAPDLALRPGTTAALRRFREGGNRA